jgi:hypothetical protein
MHHFLRILIRRLGQAILVALFVSTLCFAMLRVLLGDMAYRIAAGRYGYDLTTGAGAERVRAELGLDRPALDAWLSWMNSLLHFDFGVSFITGRTVWYELSLGIGHTLELAIVAIQAISGQPWFWLRTIRRLQPMWLGIRELKLVWRNRESNADELKCVAYPNPPWPNEIVSMTFLEFWLPQSLQKRLRPLEPERVLELVAEANNSFHKIKGLKPKPDSTKASLSDTWPHISYHYKNRAWGGCHLQPCRPAFPRRLTQRARLACYCPRGNQQRRARAEQRIAEPTPMFNALISCRNNGAQGLNWTGDTRIFSPLLYQLSYLGPSSTSGAAL